MIAPASLLFVSLAYKLARVYILRTFLYGRGTTPGLVKPETRIGGLLLLVRVDMAQQLMEYPSSYVQVFADNGTFYWVAPGLEHCSSQYLNQFS